MSLSGAGAEAVVLARGLAGLIRRLGSRPRLNSALQNSRVGDLGIFMGIQSSCLSVGRRCQIVSLYGVSLHGHPVKVSLCRAQAPKPSFSLEDSNDSSDGSDQDLAHPAPAKPRTHGKCAVRPGVVPSPAGGHAHGSPAPMLHAARSGGGSSGGSRGSGGASGEKGRSRLSLGAGRKPSDGLEGGAGGRAEAVGSVLGGAIYYERGTPVSRGGVPVGVRPQTGAPTLNGSHGAASEHRGSSLKAFNENSNPGVVREGAERRASAGSGGHGGEGAIPGVRIGSGGSTPCRGGGHAVDSQIPRGSVHGMSQTGQTGQTKDDGSKGARRPSTSSSGTSPLGKHPTGGAGGGCGGAGAVIPKPLALNPRPLTLHHKP